MQKQSRYRRTWGWIAALAIVVPINDVSSARVTASAARVADDAWDTFTGDMSVQQADIASDGSVIGVSPPAMVMHVERSKGPTGTWRTSMTLANMDRPVVRLRGGPAKIDNPFLAVRMDYDGDGSAPRFYNTRGDRIASPGAHDLALLAVPGTAASMPNMDASGQRAIHSLPDPVRSDWMDNIIALPSRRPARLQALEQHYRRLRRRPDGIDQYLATSGDMTCELLVNADSALVVEMNVVRGRTLVSHTTIAHDLRPDGVMVRRLLHAERALPSPAGARAVTDVELSNVRLSSRGAQ